MTKLLTWAVFNFTVLGTLILGTMYNYEWVTLLALVIYWITALLAPLMAVIITLSKRKGIKTRITKSYNKRMHILDIIYDIIVTMTLLITGYYILAAFYFAHIFFLAYSAKVLDEVR